MITYRADASNAGSDAGYRIDVDDFAMDGGRVTGLVSTITLCRCAHKEKVAAGASPELVVLKPVDAQGNTKAGWQKDLTERYFPIDCSSGSPSPYDVGSGVLLCGGVASMGDACWPTAQGTYVLCLRDPFRPVLNLLAATQPVTAPHAQSDERYPIGIELDDGTQCRAVTGAIFGGPSSPHGLPTYWCRGSSGFIGVWGTSPSDWHGINRGPGGWSVQMGSADGPLVSRGVKKIYYVGLA